MTPGSWKTSTLGDETEKIETVDPRKSPEEEFQYVDVSSVSNETLRIDSPTILLGKDAPSRARRRIRTGDVLFATIRPTLRRIAVVPESLDGQVCSTGYYVLRAKGRLDPRFLFYHMQTQEVMDRMESLQSGASYPAVNDGHIRATSIPLPPLPEQVRIVGVLDAAFARLATATAHTQKNRTNARELFETHLNEVFSRKGAGWTEKTLDEIAENLDRKRVPITKSQRKPGNIPYYGASGEVDRVDGYIFDEELLLISEDGANLLARTYPIAFPISGKTWVNNHAHVLRFKNPILQEWVESYLNHVLIDDYVTGAAQPKLNQKALNSISIALPPEDRLSDLVECVEAMRTQTDRVRVIYKRKLAALCELKQSLLHRAFRGELSGSGVATTTSPVTAWESAGPFPFPVEGISTTDLHAGILAMAHDSHEVAGRMDRFGHVKAEKQVHMIEAVFGIDLGRKPMKEAMGPNDFPHLQKVEHRARKANFFNFKRDKDGGRYTITKLNSFDRIKQKATDALGDRAADVEKLLEWMTPMTVQQAEIVATVFAGWNNLLLDGIAPTDEQIVAESRENWHIKKMEIERDKFFKAIAWLRKEGVVPVGRGKRVAAKGNGK